MKDLDERVIDGLTVRIDRLICVGFGDCIDAAPSLFELDGEAIAVFQEGAEDVGPDTRERLMAACEACPVDAITVHDAEGRRVSP